MTLYVWIDFDLPYSDAQRHMGSLMLHEIRSCAFCKKKKQEEIILGRWGCRGFFFFCSPVDNKELNNHILCLNKTKKSD